MSWPPLTPDCATSCRRVKQDSGKKSFCVRVGWWWHILPIPPTSATSARAVAQGEGHSCWGGESATTLLRHPGRALAQQLSQTVQPVAPLCRAQLPQPQMPQRRPWPARRWRLLQRRAQWARTACRGTAPPRLPASHLCGIGWGGTACPRAAGWSFENAAPVLPCPAQMGPRKVHKSVE